MKWSILIAAYDADVFLPSALKGIRQQTSSDWELIVVEDGSSDGTESLVRSFADSHTNHNVVYDRFESNRGVATARNRLLELASGDYLAFLDADDQWLPKHLENLEALFKQGHVLGVTPIEIWQEGGSSAIYRPSGPQLASPVESLYAGSFIQTSSCVAMTQAAVKQTGGFDVSLRVGEDRDYWFRVLQGGGTLGCTDSVTCRYRKHLSSAMAKTMLVAEDAVKFYTKHLDSNVSTSRHRRHHLSEALCTYARLIRRETPARARRAFLEAWKYSPVKLTCLLRALFSFASK